MPSSEACSDEHDPDTARRKEALAHHQRELAAVTDPNWLTFSERETRLFLRLQNAIEARDFWRSATVTFASIAAAQLIVRWLP